MTPFFLRVLRASACPIPRLGVRASAVALTVALMLTIGLSAADETFTRDPKLPVDQQYTQKIHEYTTEPFFLSPLIDYLPASKTVPTPEAVLGDVAGAPNMLPYAEDVYRYMRMLEKAAPKNVKVFSIGHTEEGREMIAVAISSEKNMADLEANRQRLEKLGDPRTIKMDDRQAQALIKSTVPIYYITGTIHSPETGAPTALMELAYRLTVDRNAYLKTIRDNVITLITPVVEVDGRDRMVDIYKWHRAHPDENWPNLVYWGKYVAHDNNRDAMGVTLDLTKNILAAYIHWKPLVLHDLHESEPYLYDNTIGDGPYNAWIDPILAGEWHQIGWENVAEMTKYGMPGVYTHGYYDTWSPGYLMFIAALHNGISRLYETFGNGGADTQVRTLDPDEYSRTWYRQNPPLPQVKWSQRDNNNYEETGLLVSLHYFAENRDLFMRNFWLKSKRSIEKPKNEGPAAYVFPADDPRNAARAHLLHVLQLQGCEISRATAAFTVSIPGDKAGASSSRTFPAGSFIVRMDQPYSRIADALLDHQYWSPDDPQKTPYDDTGWSFPELFNVQTVRVTDQKVLDAPMQLVAGDVTAAGGVSGSGTVFVANNTTDDGLIALRYKLKDANIDVAEEPFDLGGRHFNRGSFIIRNLPADALANAAKASGVEAIAADAAPSVKSHPARAARIAFVHTWLSTQDEGWWRERFDAVGIPYTYISTQVVATEADLRSKYDVIVFPPVGYASTERVIHGMPTDWGNPLPWKKTELTPNLGRNDSTDDMRPGLGWSGVAHLQAFVKAGGLLITSTDTSNFAVSLGMTPGVSIRSTQHLRIVGTVLRTEFVDKTSPLAYGYNDDELSVYAPDGLVFDVSNIAGRRPSRPSGDERPTGRGLPGEQDVPQGRPFSAPPATPEVKKWEAPPVTPEQRLDGIGIIPPDARPRVVLRWADSKDLLASGLLEGGSELADRPAVIDAPSGKGHVLLFAINPVYRGETFGSHALVFNAILNFDHLDAGRAANKR